MFLKPCFFALYGRATLSNYSDSAYNGRLNPSSIIISHLSTAAILGPDERRVEMWSDPAAPKTKPPGHAGRSRGKRYRGSLLLSSFIRLRMPMAMWDLSSPLGQFSSSPTRCYILGWCHASPAHLDTSYSNLSIYIFEKESNLHSTNVILISNGRHQNLQ